MGKRPSHEIKVSAIYSKSIRKPLKVRAGEWVCPFLRVTLDGAGDKCGPRERSVRAHCRHLSKRLTEAWMEDVGEVERSTAEKVKATQLGRELAVPRALGRSKGAATGGWWKV